MVYLLTFLLALPSGLIWLVNAEALVVVQVTTTDAAPWAIALITTFGQFIGYSVLFLAASTWLARWGPVRRAVERFRPREGAGTYTVFATGGLCGVPPLLALFAVYGSARSVRLRRLLAVAIPGRIGWYMTWAYATDFMREHLGFMTS